MRTYITSKSLKRAAGTLALTLSVVSAVFGLTGCGSHGGGGMRGGDGGGGVSGQSYSAPSEVTHTIR
jgi:hypothetical protein